MSSKDRESDEYIHIKGARVNNLKNIDVSIPRNRLVVITGLSGSGKSSLAFDTLYAEGQRRYVESLSSYARQFMGRMNKPDVDYIKGISPAVAIEQKVKTNNPRSTVGTSTEIYEYLKLLFARIGKTYSPVSGREVKRHSVNDVLDFVLDQPDGSRLMLLAPIDSKDKTKLAALLEILLQEGFARAVVDGQVLRIEDFMNEKTLFRKCKEVLLLIDRIALHADEGNPDELSARISDSIETAFYEGHGICFVEKMEENGNTRFEFSNRFEADGITFEKPNPNFFSFNNPYGACPTCQGFGNITGIDEDIVVPNKKLSVYEDAVVCWRGEKMSEWKSFLIKQSGKIGFPIHRPYLKLSEKEKDMLWNGAGEFPGINGFFSWVESQAYKIQYRVMLARYRGKAICPDCKGTRLRKDAGYVKIAGKSIIDLVLMPVDELYGFVTTLQLTPHEREISQRIMTELTNRLKYLLDVGLGYLTLNRLSNTLSGGESQRINLATSLGSSLVGSTYILDEPSIGLHPRDTRRLIEVLKKLRDLGNTVVVVEHDEEIIKSADYIIDIGPYAGRLGGEVVFAGDYRRLISGESKSLTAAYLKNEMKIDVPKSRRHARDFINVEGAWAHNLKEVNVSFPLHNMVVVTGVSGSGKTTLVKHVLYDVLQKRFNGAAEYTGKCSEVSGALNSIAGVELIDQNPIGRSSRSNPASYIKAYDEIRQLYASQPLAQRRGYKPGYFSFNVEGGRCETCQGEGMVSIGMQFMADVHLVCEECHGHRFKEETLEILYREKNISEILDMTVDQAIEFFHEDNSPSPKRIVERLKPLQDVGLGYLKLGQPSSSLSGGEAQRIKLASFLVKGASAEPLLFIFDEPSTGLHLHDIRNLITSFNTLIENGHSIIVIEHHQDIIKVADHVIDMGPEGGVGGGNVVFAGTPEELVKCKESHTAKYLKDKLL